MESFFPIESPTHHTWRESRCFYSKDLISYLKQLFFLGVKKCAKWLNEFTKWRIYMSFILGKFLVLSIKWPTFLCKIGGKIELLLKLWTCSPLTWPILHSYPNLNSGCKTIMCKILIAMSPIWTFVGLNPITNKTPNSKAFKITNLIWSTSMLAQLLKLLTIYWSWIVWRSVTTSSSLEWDVIMIDETYFI